MSSLIVGHVGDPPGVFERTRDWMVARPSAFTLTLILLLAIGVGTVNPAFLQLANLFDMVRASVVLGLFALGVLVVLAAGGLDVSFTAIAALCMYALTKLALAWWPTAPVALMFLVMAAAGALLGGLNGFLVHRLQVPSLIVTIGTQYVFRGVLLTFVGTALYMNLPPALERFGTLALIEAQSSSGGRAILPAFSLVLATAAVLTWWLLNRTLLGRAVYGVGGSAAIAQRLGFDVGKVQIFAFGYAGMLAGIAGTVHVASNRLANPFDLAGLELDVIAAVVLGGARITGGSGTVTGALLGVVLVVLVNNVLILVGIPSTWQKVIVGTFIVVAGALFGLRRTR